MNEPPPSADTGRTPRGTFATGNQFSTGNPHASKVQKLRTAMLQAITETDVQVIIAKLIDLARDGDLKAMALLFATIGKPSDDRPPAAITSSIRQEIAMLHRRDEPTAVDNGMTDERRARILASVARIRSERATADSDV